MTSWISSEDDSSKQRKFWRSRDTRERTSGIANEANKRGQIFYLANPLLEAPVFTFQVGNSNPG